MIINDLKKRASTGFGLYLTGSKEEKKYIRENGCTYIIKNSDIVGYKIAVIKNKKTGEKITVPIYKGE